MYNNYYFLGIGGIGMSALARYFKYIGKNVSGYDRTPSKLTGELEKEGIEIHYEDRPDLIPRNTEKTMVIYTPAIPADLEELKYVKANGYSICKRSRALGEVTRYKECLAVSGTHGKTSTSSMLAHIFTHSQTGCTAFLGGIAKNFHSNLILNKNNVVVAEADEFDRSFLQLHPLIALITAVDADHLDIYGNYNHVVEAFSSFAAQVDADGTLIIHQGVDIDLSGVRCKVLRYNYDTPSDFYASNIVPLEGGYFSFTLNYPGGKIEECRIGIPGRINVENGIAAAAMALSYGLDPIKIREALKTFAGVERRFDIQVNKPQCAYVDDYAHHPNEIATAIRSIRDIFPARKITGVFQPHLYTRTRDFAEEFAQALSTLDSVIMLPIYPAREQPIEGVTSSIIFDHITVKDKVLIQKEALMDTLSGRNLECLVTFGAGDIDRFVPKIKEMLDQR